MEWKKLILDKLKELDTANLSYVEILNILKKELGYKYKLVDVREIMKANNIPEPSIKVGIVIRCSKKEREEINKIASNLFTSTNEYILNLIRKDIHGS